MIILFVMPRTTGRGVFFFFFRIRIFFFDGLHVQIIASISPKASVENSSAQWAIFIQIDNAQVDEIHIIQSHLFYQATVMKDHSIFNYFKYIPISYYKHTV